MGTEQEAEHVPVEKPVSDTRHEPHEHARPRVVWGLIALLVVLAGVLVWDRWGERIKEVCLGGDTGACVVEGFESLDGGTTFDSPEGF